MSIQPRLLDDRLSSSLVLVTLVLVVINLILLITISYAVLKWRNTIKQMVDEEKQLVLRHYPSHPRPPTPLNDMPDDTEKSSSESSTTKPVKEEFNKPNQTPLPPPYASTSSLDPQFYHPSGELKAANRKSLKFAPSYSSIGFRYHSGSPTHAPTKTVKRARRHDTGSCQQSIPESSFLDITPRGSYEDSAISHDSSGSSVGSSTECELARP